MRTLIILTVLAACSPMVYTHGVPNLAEVSPGVWRSGQITSADGWAYVEQLAAGRHVRVVKLNFDAEGQDDLPPGAVEVYLPIQPEGDQDVWDDLRSVFEGPDPAAVGVAVEQLRECADNPTTELCLVHCTHGQDRTGYVVGRFRVLIGGWTKERAYREMLAHHFHPELRGLQEAWDRSGR